MSHQTLWQNLCWVTVKYSCDTNITEATQTSRDLSANDASLQLSVMSLTSSHCGRCFSSGDTWQRLYMHWPFNGHITTAEQPTNIRQYADWYTGRWWMGCYIRYSENGSRRAAAPPSPHLAVLNVTAHLSTASVPTSYYSMWCYNYQCALKG